MLKRIIKKLLKRNLSIVSERKVKKLLSSEFDDVIISISSKMSKLSTKIIEYYGDFKGDKYIYIYMNESKFLDLNKLYSEISHSELKTELDNAAYKTLMFVETQFPLYFKMISIIGTLYSMIYKLSSEKYSALDENIYLYEHLTNDEDYVESLKRELSRVDKYVIPLLDSQTLSEKTYGLTEKQYDYVKSTLKFCMIVANSLNDFVNKLKVTTDETVRNAETEKFNNLLLSELKRKVSSEINQITW